jgi:hypothetical protein
MDINIKKFKDYVLERFGTYNPIPVPMQSPKINQFSQGTPNGMAGTSDPNAKKIDNDDPIKVGYKRFLNDINPSNKIKTGNSIMDGDKPKRKWRKKREEKKRLKLNELFEPRKIDYKIVDTIVKPSIYELNVAFIIDLDGLEYRFIFHYDKYIKMDFKVNKEEYTEHDGWGERTEKGNMLNILGIVGELFEEFKKIAKNNPNKYNYIVDEIIANPSKDDEEDSKDADETKRGKIYKYWMESKISQFTDSYEYFTTDYDMGYELNPPVELEKISFL